MILAAAIAAPLSGDDVLARAKEVFRAHVRPAYVAYTLDRRDRTGGIPDFGNSYELKIWCRTSDRSALTRRAHDGRAIGELIHETIAFDGRVDPGPPAADIFERALYGSATPSPQPSGQPPPIGAVSVAVEYDYRVSALDADGPDWHLRLEPRRDPQRNRIDDLWVDRESYEVRRMRVRDHLYMDMGRILDVEFDVHFTQRDGLPVIDTIHGVTAGGVWETDYRFIDLTFPRSMPSWYFDPKSYGSHAEDAPS